MTLTNPEGNTPGTWAWADSTQSVGNVVSPAATFKANFTPTDTANYNTVENVDVIVTVGKADSAVPKAPEAKTLTYTGSAQALVTAGTAEGGTMQYALGENATTAPADDLYTTTIPTATDAGTYYVWYKAKGDTTHSDSKAACVTVTIAAETEYSIKFTQGTEHILESNTDAVITVTNPVDDSKTFINFNGVAVGGKPVSKSDYDAVKGSLVLTLKAGYLNTLSAGTHKVTISFKDGSVETTLKILAPTPEPLPKTGDSGSPALWLGLILLGALTLGGLILAKRKG